MGQRVSVHQARRCQRAAGHAGVDHARVVQGDAPALLAAAQLVPVHEVDARGAGERRQRWQALADDLAVAGMAEKCKGAVIYFTRQPASELVAAHRAAGGRVVELRGGEITWSVGEVTTKLGTLAEYGIAPTDDAEIDALLAALATARFLDILVTAA